MLPEVWLLQQVSKMSFKPVKSIGLLEIMSFMSRCNFKLFYNYFFKSQVPYSFRKCKKTFSLLSDV